jgi:hypothetical protein
MTANEVLHASGLLLPGWDGTQGGGLRWSVDRHPNLVRTSRFHLVRTSCQAAPHLCQLPLLSARLEKAREPVGR